MQAKPSISLCMIVKDEEPFLAQCIESVRPIVAEIIVVDTGSRDKTKQIAAALGARVFERNWENDFAATRNFSLAQATAAWILVLDADEAIAAKDHAALLAHTADSSKCYEFLQRHYTNDIRLSNFKPCKGEYPEWERSYVGHFDSNLCRLFPNRAGIQYRGKVHELVEHSIREIGIHSIERSPIPIHHYGHTPEVQARKNKSKIYTALGEQKAKAPQAHWQAYFELGVEHNVNGRRTESVEQFQRALKENPAYVPAWVNLGYVLCELGRYEEAVKALENAIRIEPKACEAYCNLGVVFLRTKQYELSARCSIKAIELNQNYLNAYSNLSKAFWFDKKPKEAIHVLLKALEVAPRCAPIKADLGTLLSACNKLEDAEKVLREALNDDPKCSQAQLTLGQLFRQTGRAKEALETLSNFCASQDGNKPSSPLVLTASELNQIKQQCKELEQQVSSRRCPGQHRTDARPRPA